VHSVSILKTSCWTCTLFEPLSGLWHARHLSSPCSRWLLTIPACTVVMATLRDGLFVRFRAHEAVLHSTTLHCTARLFDGQHAPSLPNCIHALHALCCSALERAHAIPSSQNCSPIHRAPYAVVKLPQFNAGFTTSLHSHAAECVNMQLQMLSVLICSDWTRLC
jgi:hypothetical protein